MKGVKLDIWRYQSVVDIVSSFGIIFNRTAYYSVKRLPTDSWDKFFAASNRPRATILRPPIATTGHKGQDSIGLQIPLLEMLA